MRGKLPSASARPPCLASPVIVPIASKKFVKNSVNTSIVAASAPIRSNAPNESCPNRLRSGTETSELGRAGTVRCQPPGFVSDAGPRCSTDSATIATTVVATSPMSSPPLTLRATRTPMVSSPTTNTSVGTEVIDPPSPSWTGGPPGVRVTNPASTNPMNAMNRPMPTVIAALSWRGTALKIADRAPVTASSTMSRPLTSTSPIASGHVTSPMTATARNELMPSPAASANGRFATSPNRMVRPPAARPVIAPTCAVWSHPPATSTGAFSALVPPRMRGLRMTMYAIAKKVTSPPRSSRPVVEPRSVIRKKRSSRPGAGPVPRASSFPAVSRRMPRRVTSLCPFLRYRSAARPVSTRPGTRGRARRRTARWRWPCARARPA